MISSDGKFKRVSIDEITEISNRATTVVKLKNNITLKSCLLCEENSYLYIISDIGRIIKIKITEKNYPFMGKLAQGTNIMKLFPGENIIEAINISEKQIEDLVLITSQGSFIKHKTKEIKVSQKGELGTMGINLKDNKKINDRVINCFINNQYVYLKTDKEKYERLKTDKIDNSSYQKEKKLDIKLDNNEFIKSIFSIIIPEKN